MSFGSDSDLNRPTQAPHPEIRSVHGPVRTRAQKTGSSPARIYFLAANSNSTRPSFHVSRTYSPLNLKAVKHPPKSVGPTSQRVGSKSGCEWRVRGAPSRPLGTSRHCHPVYGWELWWAHLIISFLILILIFFSFIDAPRSYKRDRGGIIPLCNLLYLCLFEGVSLRSREISPLLLI